MNLEMKNPAAKFAIDRPIRQHQPVIIKQGRY